MGAWDQWDATQLLQGAPANLGRRIGVTVGIPFHHRGADAIYVEVHRDTPRVNTTTWGNCYPVAEVGDRTREAFNSTIAELDELICHLMEHRDRLKAELETLPKRVFMEAIPVPAPIEEPVEAVPAMVDVHLPESA